MSPQRLLLHLLQETDASVLSERSYVMPSSGDKVMFDLYCLYAMWYQWGSGRNAYGHSTTNVTSSGREKLIDRTFYECLSFTASMLAQETIAAAREELENIEDEYLLPPNEVAAYIEEKVPGLRSAIIDSGEALDPVNTTTTRIKLPEHVSLQDTIRLFQGPFWAEHADEWGGEKWADITTAAMQLLDAIKRGKEPKDLMYAVDRLYDVEHNTGGLAEKLGKAKVSKAALDKRAEISSIRGFLPYVSPQISNIVTALPESHVGVHTMNSVFSKQRLAENLLDHAV